MIQDVSTDVRFADIGNLPSNFFPYVGEFKALSIRPLLVGELKLLSRAAVTKNVISTIKAIDQTINVPVQRLTIGDFYFVLMWHKLHSFPKTPLSVTWECKNVITTNIDGVIVNDGTHVNEEYCNQPNAQLIHQSNIEIIDLEDDFVGINENLDYPRVSLLPDIIDYTNDPDYSYLIGAVQWVKIGDTLKEKFEYLEMMDDISLYEEAESTQKNVVHGVNEHITLKCSRCGGIFTKKLVLDPVNFFRPCL